VTDLLSADWMYAVQVGQLRCRVLKFPEPATLVGRRSPTVTDADAASQRVFIAQQRNSTQLNSTSSWV